MQSIYRDLDLILPDAFLFQQTVFIVDRRQECLRQSVS